MKRKKEDRGAERSRIDQNQFGILRISITVLLLLQALSSFFPGPFFWGINHLAYARSPLRVLWPLFGLVLIWTEAGVSFGRWLVNRLAPILPGNRLASYVAAPLVGTLLFWLLRCKTYFLGDGWLLGEMVNFRIPFSGFNFVQYHLVERLFAGMSRPVEADAFRLFAGTSIVAGALYLIAVAWSSRNLSKNNGQQIMLYGLLIFFAPVEMFMGYVECYSTLMVFMLLFGVTAALYYLKKLPIWVPGAAFGLGLAFHLDALFMAPLLPALVIWPAENAPRSMWKRAALLALPILAAAGLAVAFLLTDGYNRSNFVTDFVKSRQTQRILVTLGGPHGLVSWLHWKDVLNLLLLLAPIPLAMFAASMRRRKDAENRSKSERRALLTLLFGSLWVLFLISTVNMKLGMARDWDLFAAQSTFFVLASWLAWPKFSGGRPDFRFVGTVVLGAVFLSLPWFSLNASAARPIQRFKDMIRDEPPFSQAYAHEEIGKYYRKLGNRQAALEEYKTAARLFPDNARFYGVLGGVQYSYGMVDDALSSFQYSLKADSTYAIALRMMARIYYERNESGPALPYVRKLAGSPREKSDDAVLHALVAGRLGLYEEALEAYRKAVRMDPRRTDLLPYITNLEERLRSARPPSEAR